MRIFAYFVAFSSWQGGNVVVKADNFGSFTYFPQRADQVCEGLTQAVYDLYPQFEMTCDCSGAPLITDPLTGIVTPLGDVFVQCMSNNFFTSEDGKVWWYLYWSAKFNDGLESITQQCTYVRGRKYDDSTLDKDDLYRERFTYLPKTPDQCGFQQRSTIGNDLSCDVCERVVTTNPLVPEDASCYKIDCTNLDNNLFIKSPTFVVDDTCSVPRPITDFENQPLAATLGFLQDNVKQVYYPGGPACISPITTIWDEVREDLECTCEPTDYDGLGEGEVAVLVSCQYPCIYGPESGEIELLLYFERLWVHTDTNPYIMDEGGSAAWTGQRYEYIKGRGGTETYRFDGDSCFVTRSDGVACDCSFVSDNVQLDCENGDVLVFNRYEQTETDEPWETMHFAARWKKESVCLRALDLDATPATTIAPPTNSTEPEQQPTSTASSSQVMSTVTAPSPTLESTTTITSSPTPAPTVSPVAVVTPSPSTNMATTATTPMPISSGTAEPASGPMTVQSTVVPTPPSGSFTIHVSSALVVLLGVVALMPAFGV